MKHNSQNPNSVTLRWVLAVAACGILATSANAASGNEIPLVLTQELTRPNVPAIELYRRVFDELEQSPDWRPMPMSTVRSSLPKLKAASMLGALPVIDRKLLLRAHPQAKGKDTSAKRRMIAPVQAMLDTLALPAALVVDCTPARGGLVSLCGLYYYSRSEARIVAQAQKDFAVPIKDPTRWAPQLISSLQEGLKATRKQQEMQAVEGYLSKQDADDAPLAMTLEVRGMGLAVRDPSRNVSGVPGAELVVGSEGHTYSFGLGLNYASAAATGDGLESRYEEKGVGLQFSAMSKALESMTWDLGLSLGAVRRFAERTVRESDDPELVKKSGRLRTDNVRLGLSPGLLWQASESISFGGQVSYFKYLPYLNESSGAYADEQIDTNVLAVGLRLKATL